MGRRLTRKEVKRDEVRESMARIFEYILSHQALLIWSLTGVIFLIGVGAAIAHFSNVRETKAHTLLAETIESYSAMSDAELGLSFGEEALSAVETQTTLATAKGSFESLRSKFGSSDAAGLALIYLADIAVRSGNLDEAQDLWEEYLSKNSDHMLAAQVQTNLFSSKREDGRAEEVEAELRELLAQAETALPQDALLYQLGLTLESLEKSTEAKEIFARLLEQHPESPFVLEAQRRSPDGPSQAESTFNF